MREIIVDVVLEVREKSFITEVAGVRTVLPRSLVEHVEKNIFHVKTWLAKKIAEAVNLELSDFAEV